MLKWRGDVVAVVQADDITYLMEVKPMTAAVTKKAEPAAKMDVATPGYGFVEPPWDDVGLDDELDVLEPEGREVGLEVEVEDPPEPEVVIDFPSALSWKFANVSSPEVGGLMAKTIPPRQCPATLQ